MSFLKIHKIRMECGPDHDRRTMDLTLHPFVRRIGVMVSGGMDSALLYYLLRKYNSEIDNWYNIIPYTMLRKEGSPVHAPLIINYVNRVFGLPNQELIVVGNNTLPEENQVSSGIDDIMSRKQCNILYLGLIENLEIHTVGWRPPIKWFDTEQLKYPLKRLTKCHVVDLIQQLNQPKLFELSHSCVYSDGRCITCNGCKERAWGFEQMGYIDPGVI
jgi:hypothetical protein